MSSSPAVPGPGPPNAPDAPSAQGKFGWACVLTIPANGRGDGNFILVDPKNFVPFLLRRRRLVAASGAGAAVVLTEKFVSVRMMERAFLSRLVARLPPAVLDCHRPVSVPATDREALLLNDINVVHAGLLYGPEAFRSNGGELLVRTWDGKRSPLSAPTSFLSPQISSEDAIQAFAFYNLCHRKLVERQSDPSGDRCGFIRINGESVFPYVSVEVKTADHNNNSPAKKYKRVVPTFYFDDEISQMNLTVDVVSGWDVAYIKFCCKIQVRRIPLKLPPQP